LQRQTRDRQQRSDTHRKPFDTNAPDAWLCRFFFDRIVSRSHAFGPAVVFIPGVMRLLRHLFTGASDNVGGIGVAWNIDSTAVLELIRVLLVHGFLRE
jgi:hypothetical protein